MPDGKPSNGGDAERRRPLGSGSGRKGSGPIKQRGFVERATAQGHSGYGLESVRPHLRDQLRLKALLPTPFPTPEEDPQPSRHGRRR
jgi:hypothetical protein